MPEGPRRSRSHTRSPRPRSNISHIVGVALSPVRWFIQRRRRNARALVMDGAARCDQQIRAALYFTFTQKTNLSVSRNLGPEGLSLTLRFRALRYEVEVCLCGVCMRVCMCACVCVYVRRWSLIRGKTT